MNFKKSLFLVLVLTFAGPLMALTDYQLTVDTLVRDDTQQITVEDRDRAIQSSVLKYSQDKPRDWVEDVVAASAQILPLPTNWEAGFSSLQSIEYPIGNIPPTHVSPGAHGMYNHPSLGLQITLRSAIENGATVRVNYTRVHIVNDVSDTTPAHHRDPIANYAASLLLDQLATRYAGDSDSTIQADSVDHNSKSREYAARAKLYRGFYYTSLGIKQNGVKAASATVDLDLPGSRLQHRS